MAATVSSVWAKPKTWALETEEHEEELNNLIMAQPTPKPEPPAADFPSLSAAATAKPKKKNKAQTLSLAEFTTYGSAKPSSASAAPQRLTQDELMMLPTGPREKTAEELERPRLGGGFRNYGGDNSRVRVSDRGSNRDRERDMGPSRADEADDWSKSKKVGGGGFGGGFGGGPSERREKGGFFNSSRADEVDNWASNKSFVAGPIDGPRRERRMGFESYSNGSGPDSDNWGRKKEERVVGGGAEGDSWGRRESNGGGSGRPRLNLQPRTLPVTLPVVNVSNGSNNVGSNGGLSVTPTEAKVKGANPFGEARPREEVLAEKGKDWKEIDEKLEAVKIKELENAEKSEGFGKRRGFGLGRSDSGDDKNVKSWRKPDSTDAVPAPTDSSVDATENSADAAEGSAEDAEKVSEEN